MGQYNNRRRALWFLAGASALIACTAALILIFAGRKENRDSLFRETAQAETVEEHNRADGSEGRETDEGGIREVNGKTDLETESKRGGETDLPAGIPGGQVKTQEESYCLVSENGFLFVFAKDRSSICLDTHMPLSEFPLAEQERLLDGVWFSSMIEVFHYLESYTS